VYRTEMDRFRTHRNICLNITKGNHTEKSNGGTAAVRHWREGRYRPAAVPPLDFPVSFPSEKQLERSLTALLNNSGSVAYTSGTVLNCFPSFAPGLGLTF
jgi:hypothetical protein